MRIHSGLQAAFIALTVFTSVALADSVPVPVVCVVNGDKFADHKHPPILVTYQGKTMAVCCKNCERKFNKDPEKYLKLYEAAIKAK